ncbi:MAG TPA: hypothetical protein VNX88_24620 [Terriglobales bacterium]|jgi:hypothetical protein|nr:hypothetical protein [Terriglobales bacterium]
MSCVHNRSALISATAVMALLPVVVAQSELQTRTLVINGQSGKAVIYRINNQSFIDLESLARIGNGSVSFHGDQIILTLPSSAAAAVPDSTLPHEGMTRPFMSSAVQDLALIKDWHTKLAYAIQRGIPGDGSRIVVLHDRAAEGLRLASVDASSHSDRQALQLLTNNFNQVDQWKRKLVDARKSMSSANYSLTPDALEKDSEYQKIVSCNQFLGTMLTGGQYQDNASCH